MHKHRRRGPGACGGHYRSNPGWATQKPGQGLRGLQRVPILVAEAGEGTRRSRGAGEIFAFSEGGTGVFGNEALRKCGLEAGSYLARLSGGVFGNEALREMSGGVEGKLQAGTPHPAKRHRGFGEWVGSRAQLAVRGGWSHRRLGVIGFRGLYALERE